MNFLFRYINKSNALVTNSGTLDQAMDSEKARILNDKEQAANKAIVNSSTDANNLNVNVKEIKLKKRVSPLTTNNDKEEEEDETDENDDENDYKSTVAYTKKELNDKKKLNISDNLADETTSSSPHVTKSSPGSNFFYRLLACGGSCTGRRRTSNSMQAANLLDVKPLNDPIGIRKPSNGESSSLKKISPDHPITNENGENVSTLKHSLAKQHKSNNDLFNEQAADETTIENSYEYASYESIIDKFDHSIVNSNMYHTQENFSSFSSHNNNNKMANSKQHATAAVAAASSDKSTTETTKNEKDNSSKLVLPILKINDDYVNSPNVSGRKHATNPTASTNTDESVSVEEFDEDEEEDEEIIELEDDEEDEEFEDECDDLKMLILNQSDYDEFYVTSFETDKSARNTASKAQLHLSDGEKNKKLNEKSTDTITKLKEHAKHDLPNVAKPDKNNKTHQHESLNLVSQTSLSFESTTTPSRKSHDLNDSSNECFQLKNKPQLNGKKDGDGGVKSSISNFSLKNNFETDLNDESINSADNGANLFVPLLMARNKNKNNLNNSSRQLLDCNNDASFLSSSVSSSMCRNSKSPSPFHIVTTELEIAIDSVSAPLTFTTNPVNAKNTTNKDLNKSAQTTEQSDGLKENANNLDITNEESSDILNEISKVNNWLSDTNNHHDERNFKLDSTLPASPEVNLKVGNENSDSAIDMRSNCSVSNVSKGSSSKLVRIRWESFNKYYRTHIQQATSSSTATNYQIAAMSLEQIMSLRKLALLQFSKLLERQHSTMHRTLRIFSSKNKDIVEFQRVYDSIDSLAKADSPKTKSSPSNGDRSNMSDENYESLIIENKKIIHQLGAPKERGKRHKAQSSIKSTNEKSFSDRRDISGIEKSIISDPVSLSSKPIEKVISINTKGFTLMPSTVFGTSLNAIIQHTGQPLPHRILEAMRYIRKIAQNEVGIFRKNGVKTRINKLKESINRNESINYQSSDYTPFDIADTIKLYFRELPECLITNKLSDILLSNYDRIRPEDRKMILQQVMLLIPDENRLVLQTLLLFLSEIAKYYKINQMTRSNLAVCFSPVIFRFNLEKKSKLKQPSAISTNPNLSSSNFKASIYTLNNLKENNEEENNSTSVEPSTTQPSDLQQSGHQNLQNLNSDLKSPACEINNNTVNSDQQTPLVSINESAQLATSTPLVAAKVNSSQVQSPQMAKNTNYKRKYSEKINKAASSIVNFGSELNKPNRFLPSSDSAKGSFENMSKIIQLCVSDMIKYSVDLFNVPVENFENLKQTITNSDPPGLDHYYDVNSKSLKKSDFFNVNIKLDKNFWYYMDKFEDVSIYFCKDETNENKQQQQQLDDLTTVVFPEISLTNNEFSSANVEQIYSGATYSNSISNTIVTSTNFLTLMPQRFETFTDKLKLWKCCTLIKQKNVTLEQILNRIKYERQFWDDDFVEGKIAQVLDDNTELYNYTISFMPPHSPRDFYELRHASKLSSSANDTFILTSTSIKQKNSTLSPHDIRSNTILSKYVVEKLIATDTATTFKITHYIKLDYKGFTLEFYNKAFGYMMARQLFNLKMSLKDVGRLQVL